MVHHSLDNWSQIQGYILQLEQEGLVTRTFRRLDPERQRTVLTAILEEAVEWGPTAINIKRVAERAGVSVGALYTYFPDRDGMLDFAVELCLRFMTDAFNTYRPYFGELPLREALTAYVSGGVEWSKTQTHLVQFFARAAYHRDSTLSERLVRPVATIMREIVHDILVQAEARGEIRDDVDLEATARVIYAAMVAISDGQLLPYLNAYFQVTDEEVSPARATDAMIDLILSGITRDNLQQEPKTQ